ncbi:probable serine/threonine-protein kinase PBL12 [Lactuca sativa]|uniref:probable serine/threonine-protein kinase PBL12 n=1 Tax=Lactuca sativa TaxID=4236 RepID=UPI0022AE8102|nr:probable serine/threonine-protein kinase PBL12 [Lactuca sativa]XP_052620268.1 probable serine/threonine-protein kinase PBL12 [Lactuca sativa]
MSDLKRFEHLKIQLQAIKSATNNFAEDHCIGRGGFGKVYRGELGHLEGHTVVALKCLDRAFGQGDREFWNEILMLSLYKHENIVSLLGFCDDDDKKILVYEYASKRGLDLYLNSHDLTWVRRLKICIGAARGLSYLHDSESAGTQQRVLHRDIKSSNILLDENWNAMIADFGLSKFCPANLQYSLIFSNLVGTFGYWDPLYVETGLLTKESDVYSFGVVLFEVLCGRLCTDNYDKSQSFTELVRKHYKQNNLNEIIFGDIKDEINTNSLKVFSTIAYQCLKRDRDKRPSINEILITLETALEYQNDPCLLTVSSHPKRMPIKNKFKHLEIQLEAIKLATNDFAEHNCIGVGGFGKVYKGQLIHLERHTTFAFKRFGSTLGQGDPEFWKEIIMLSLYKHENIVSLLGFCDERGEKILVYEYASKRSLDLYLNKDLTWVTRLKICIGVARGLVYLHNPPRTHQKVIHRDIKSSNILLDENWNAKITDFGLSEFGPTSQQYPFVVLNVLGTYGYCDPLYEKTGFLTEESDVYSFGVVLFEVLCGRLSMHNVNDKHQALPFLVQKCYEQNNLDEIIYGSIRDQINPSSLKAFKTIAYQCLNKEREERPLMKEIVRALETALRYQGL